MTKHEREQAKAYEQEIRRRKERQARRRKRKLYRKIEKITISFLAVLSLCVVLLIAARYVRHDEGQVSDSAAEDVLRADSSSIEFVTGQAAEGQDAGSGQDIADSGQIDTQMAEDGNSAAAGQIEADKPDTSCRIGNVGDVIIHLPITKAYGGTSSKQSHDFSPIFQTIRQAYESVDCMVVNLETSLGGSDKPYSGFPNFNAPDEIASNLRDAGVDLQLLANNHMYDNGKAGFLRTISVLQQAGITYTGARASQEEPQYLLTDINGIRIGILNYTYEMEREGDSKSINGNVMDSSVENNLNSFELSDAETFYQEVGQLQSEMYAQGAEFILFYIHWGNEYELQPNQAQMAMAQRLCDMGIDAVIGGHPHVVQPMDVLTSSDGTHRMFCAYSLGNHLSNQRRELISSRPNGHTEDGLLLNLTLTRTAGEVSITGIEAIPTYVYKSSQPQYYIIPIYQVDGIEEQTGLAGIQSAIQASYERTMNVLGSSVSESKRKLGLAME